MKRSDKWRETTQWDRHAGTGTIHTRLGGCDGNTRHVHSFANFKKIEAVSHDTLPTVEQLDLLDLTEGSHPAMGNNACTKT